MTSDEIVQQFRARVLAHADASGNVSATCRTFGISRKSFYKWRNQVQRYGLEALTPKARRAPQMPNATPTHVVERLLTLAIEIPTLGCRQYADRLAEAGFVVSKSTVQQLLVNHGLGRRAQRVARAAAIVALCSGLMTEAADDDELFGFCHWAGAPGHLLSVDSFYIGRLKGVGKVHQLAAVDTFTRWAIVWIVIGPVTADNSIAFMHRVRRQWARLGYPVRAVVADNGPEYVASRFAQALADKQITRVKIPARSPNHNAVVERFQGTMLQECWRPAFHRRHFTSIRQLQTEADSWLTTYNTRRRNHSDYMTGRRPLDLLQSAT